MINGKRVIAFIPARGGSKGLPGKNIREFCGKPLVAWSIEQGFQANYIDSVIVSTDSSEIAHVALKYGARVPFLRPAVLASDSAASSDVLFHALDHLSSTGEFYDYVVLLEPTSPLREVSDITGALEVLDHERLESIVGVAKAESSHPSFLFCIRENALVPMSGKQPVGLRRQDLREEYFYLEGSIYVATVESLRRHRSFYHATTAPWVVDRYKAIEIDEMCDFIAAEALMKARIAGELK
jgi:CMP-N,N'-diacetyllegionaminic acid synthase